MDSQQADNVHSVKSSSVEFKSRRNNANIRKRNNDTDSETEVSALNNIISHKKSKPIRASLKSDDGDVIGSKVTTVFESTKEAVSFKYGGDATAYNEIDTSVEKDSRTILERNIKIQQQLENENSTDDAVYRGLGAYRTFGQTKDISQIGSNKVTGTLGPVRAPSNLRAINRFDYQPDICKDYKETGFCGYGDSCKFLHDRSDYKSGWQLEREWETLQAKKKKKIEEIMKTKDLTSDDLEALESANVIDIDEENRDYTIIQDTELPFACLICRQDFVDPIVTNCGHYFCRQCAISNNKTQSKCVVCGKPTFGMFNRAYKLEKKLKLAGKLK